MAEAVIRQFQWRGAVVRKMVDEAAERGTRRLAELVFADAQQHVPFDLGTLSDSGRVDSEQGRDRLGRYSSVEAFVSYDTGYAVRLHEHPEYKFQPPGEGKWLEHAMQRNEANVEPAMAPPFIEGFKLP